MPTITRFEDLECWQEARRFVQLIYQLKKKIDFQEIIDLSLKLQIALFLQWQTLAQLNSLRV